MDSILELTTRFANAGTVNWIGVRPERRFAMQSLQTVAVSSLGLKGDHNQTAGKRTITLIQQEHFSAIEGYLKQNKITPEQLRRNIVVSGINLIGLKNQKFQIGDAVLEGSGICAPCSRMEETLGYGGYAAVRGHGGITAKIIQEGKIATGDQVRPL